MSDYEKMQAEAKKMAEEKDFQDSYIYLARLLKRTTGVNLRLSNTRVETNKTFTEGLERLLKEQENFRDSHLCIKLPKWLRDLIPPPYS
jgi:hypothetical protein